MLNNPQPPQIRVSDNTSKPVDRPLTEGLRNRPESRGLPKRWLVIIVVFLAVLVALGAIFMYVRTQQQLKTVKKDLESVQNNPAAQAKEANKELVAQVGKLVILPKDEEPTIATVSDLSKLQNQPFFAKAELGDKVLIYQQAKKAILFRPGANQIIELAPLNNSTPAEPTQ